MVANSTGGDGPVAIHELFTHPLLRVLRYPPSAPRRMQDLQNAIEMALDTDRPRRERVRSALLTVECAMRLQLERAESLALMLDALKGIGHQFFSPLLHQERVRLHLLDSGGELLLPTPDETAHAGLPWLTTAKPGHAKDWAGQALRVWGDLVDRLQALTESELDALDADELRSAMRGLQLHSLYNQPYGVVVDPARHRLALFEGAGIPLWDRLLLALDQREGDRRNEDFGSPCSTEAQQRTLMRLKAEAGSNAVLAPPVVTQPPPGPANPRTHRVILEPIPPSNAEDAATLKRFEVLRDPVPIAALPEVAVIDELIDRLRGEFPWATQAVSALGEDLLARRLFGAVELGSPPTLLVGLPGSGKSRLVRRIAEELNVPYLAFALSGMGDSRALLGTARGWSTGQPSPLIELLLTNRTASAFVLLDEIDKAHSDTSNCVSPTVALLNLLEPEGACRWYDTFLQTPCDLSKLMFWATANRLGPLSKPLLSRFRIIHVPEPQPEHFEAIARAARGDIAKGWGLPADALPEVSLSASQLQPRNAREVRQVVQQLLSRWAVEHCRPHQRH